MESLLRNLATFPTTITWTGKFEDELEDVYLHAFNLQMMVQQIRYRGVQYKWKKGGGGITLRHITSVETRKGKGEREE